MIDRKAWQFFMANGASRVGHRAEDAASYARDEARARELGIRFEWEPDPDWFEDSLGDHEYWCSDARREAAGYTDGRSARNQYQHGWRVKQPGSYVYNGRGLEHSHEQVQCTAYDGDSDQILASLGGTLDPDHHYERVIEAQIAGEAIAALAERDSHALDLATV